MKGFFSKLWMLTMAIILVLSTNIFSQPSERGEKTVKYVNGFKVVTGERPPINLDEVPESAYEQGKMLIKFSPNRNKFLVSPITKANELDHIQTGNESFDKLNEKYKITQYKQTISDLYRIDDNSKGHKARHEAWGFDLWYELRLDKNSDIKQAVTDFLALNEIEHAEPVYRKRRIEPVDVRPLNTSKNEKSFPNDYFFDLQWGFYNFGQSIDGVAGIRGIDIKLKEAWDIEMGNPNIIVSIHDGGVQYDHPDLAANMWPDIGPDGANTLADDHGTHVAGTIAAVTNNEIGVAGIAGGDGSGNGVRIMSIDIFEGTLSTYNGYKYAADNGAAISQNSWGYLNPNVYNQSDLDGIDYFVVNGGGEAMSGGGIVIFAAGNDSDNGSWYPGCYSSTIAVASHTNRGMKSSFSNYGAWVDISAPGTNIASTASESKYVWMSGTSMACPHISGVAALVLSHFYSDISKEQLEDALLDGVDNIYDNNPSLIGQLGTGRTNALKALQAAENRYFPKVKTHEINSITHNGATFHGSIIRDRDLAINSKGFVWGISEDLTLEHNLGYSNEGNNTLDFSSSATNLEPSTLYFVRAYATNDYGTSYSEASSFYTHSPVCFVTVDEEKNPLKGVEINFDGETVNTNENGQTIFYKKTGDYQYSITSEDYLPTGGKAIVSNENNQIKIILLPKSGITTAVNGESNACLGSEVIYNISTEHEGRWEIMGGSLIGNPYSSSIVALWNRADEGKHLIRYRVITDDNFNITYQKSVIVDEEKVLPTTDKPRIHKKGEIPILICTNPDLEYKWYKNGTLVEGETQQHFAPRNQPGSYQVQTIDHRQCPNTSNAMQVTAVMETGPIATYPNPSQGEFTIDFASKSMGSGTITVSNSHGKVVFQETFNKSEQQLSKRLNLSGLPKGIYIVRVSVDNDIPVNSKISIN